MKASLYIDRRSSGGSLQAGNISCCEVYDGLLAYL